MCKLYNKALIYKFGEFMHLKINNMKNGSIIIDAINEHPEIRRGDLYKVVMEKQKQKFGTSTSYQSISRDVERLIKNKYIKIIGGGPRSQILSLNEQVKKWKKFLKIMK